MKMLKILGVGVMSLMIFSNCQKKEINPGNNQVLESNISDQLIKEMNWINKPLNAEVINNTLEVTAEEGSDFFNNPEDGSITASAPFIYTNTSEDFVVKTLVEPDFSDQWNAVSLFIMIDSLNWIKYAFENSDATGPSIVSVVTKEKSDDANGVILKDSKSIWLAIAKKGNIFSMHWSDNNEDYKMTRLTAMPEHKNVKVGLEFQSPVGKKAIHKAHFFEIERRQIENLRQLE